MTNPRLFIFDTFGVSRDKNLNSKLILISSGVIHRKETRTLKVFNVNSPVRSSGLTARSMIPRGAIFNNAQINIEGCRVSSVTGSSGFNPE
ncbi:MAG: hypothetical protein EA390_11270 [Balneolaceae bacterium]|nr:MAG: hypothetical protein EA390_11270 [Balneolaceae bacterium]